MIPNIASAVAAPVPETNHPDRTDRDRDDHADQNPLEQKSDQHVRAEPVRFARQSPGSPQPAQPETPPRPVLAIVAAGDRALEWRYRGRSQHSPDGVSRCRATTATATAPTGSNSPGSTAASFRSPPGAASRCWWSTPPLIAATRRN